MINNYSVNLRESEDFILALIILNLNNSQKFMSFI